jgi:hypothetical protein
LIESVFAFLRLYWFEISVGLIFFYTVWILAMTVRNYQMLKYLTGGRSWAGRFKTIKERFTRMRRQDDHGLH